jgi:hypothetical protein
MKRILLVCAALACAISPLSAADKVYKLDKAVALVAKELSEKLPAGTKVVIYDIRAEKPEAGSYIIDELTYDLLQIDKLVVVDRENLEALREELSLQVSGDVSDESAQKLGAMLGAEVLITGSFDLLAANYRLATKAVQVETAQIRYLSAFAVESSAETEALFGRKTGTAKAVSAAGTAVKTAADFTGRFICSAVNPFFGIGSYMQGDMEGGGTVSFWEIAGGITLGVGIYRDENDLSNGTLLTAVGGGIIGVTVVYSLIRPWTYNRDKKVAEILDNTTIGFDGDGMTLGYRIRY